jgi:methionyl-tRNA synthetase
MIEKYFAGVIPKPGQLNAADQVLVEAIKTAATKADEYITKLDFSEGINEIRKVVDAANLYVTEQEPWKIAKDEANKERLATVLYCVAETLRAIAVLYNPVMPESSKKIWNILGANESIGDINKQNIDKVGTWGMLPAGSKVIKGEAIFPRLAEDEQ